MNRADVYTPPELTAPSINVGEQEIATPSSTAACSPEDIRRLISGRLAVIICTFAGALFGTPVFAEQEQSSAQAEQAASDDQSCQPAPYNRHEYVDFLTSDERPDSLAALNGKTIGNIEFVTLDVFDPEVEGEDTALYRFLNRVHVNTRQNVIDSQLLFSRGDTFNSSEVTETERILRSRSYLISAFIMPSRICEDSVELTVVTKDSWTTQPQTTFSHAGGETESGFGLSEGNVLGTGNSFGFGYESSQNRNRVYYEFSNPYFLNKPIDITLGYAETSDGEDTIFRLSHPFYSLNTPYAMGVRSETINSVEKIRQGEALLNEYKHNSENIEVFYGAAINISERSTSRIYLGATHERSEYSAVPTSIEPLPVSEEFIYPWIGYEYIENKFRIYRNINQIQRPEDISVGANLFVKLGYGDSEDEDSGNVALYNIRFDDVLGLGHHHLVTFSASLDGRDYSERNDIDAKLFNGNIGYNGFIDNKNRWYAGAGYSWSENLPPHRQITTGGSISLRGYPLDYLRGEELVQMTLERRYFTELHLFNVLRVGYVAFFDAAKMWGGNNRWRQLGDEFAPTRGSRMLSNVGFGLRLTSSKTHIGNVVHIDVAFPLADRDMVDEYQIRFEAQQTF